MSKTAIQYQATIEKDRSRIDTNEHKDEKTSREKEQWRYNKNSTFMVKKQKMANIGAPGTQATRSHQSEFQAKF